MPPDPERNPLRFYLVPLLACLLCALMGVGVGVTVDDGGGAPQAVTVHVDGGDKDTKPDDTVEVPENAPGALPGSADAGNHDGLKDETPPGAPDKELDAAREQQDRLAERDDLPVVTPLAAPSQRGCASRFVANHSSRRGVRPRLWVIHYTVSRNLPGVADLLGLTAMANRASSGVSWSYNVDRDGNCFYTVRESDKPWTQAAANPVSISVEVVNSGFELPFMTPAGYAKLGLIISDSAKRWAIPLQAGAVSGCTVTRAGIITHQQLGLCGGGHHDISPFSVAPVIAAARAARASGGTAVSRNDPSKYRLSVLTAGERRAAECLLRERRVAAKHGGWAKVARSHNVRATACKRVLARRNDELHRLGLTAKARRSTRHRVIHELV